jgi:hypothetical protein
MTVAEAFQIVLDLARQNVIEDGELELEDERSRQIEAIDIIEDVAVNQFGED